MAESDRIVKTVLLKASPERVWRALTNVEEFGTWFRVRLDGPFAAGETTTGQITYPGAEQYRWLSRTTRLDDEAGIFAMEWAHPADPSQPREEDPRTLVEFRVEPAEDGTRLTIIESGFDALPADRRSTAMRRNEGGWEIQSSHIKDYVEA